MNKKETVINEILTTEYAMFYRIAFSYVRTEADALDIVQESAYKAIYHANKLKNPEYAKTWICRIVINEAITFLRKKTKEQTEPILAELADREKEDMTDLKNALEKLSPEEKTVIILRFFEDMKLEEVAAVCKESVSTVKSRLYRTLKKLKLDLEI